ncbi:hypothetical protein BCAR13_970003 [Paraburkholderia caribensis]|nr:hypothetical protein BCAR13_970003 [Paraburkholderia caribensis]
MRRWAGRSGVCCAPSGSQPIRTRVATSFSMCCRPRLRIIPTARSSTCRCPAPTGSRCSADWPAAPCPSFSSPPTTMPACAKPRSRRAQRPICASPSTMCSSSGQCVPCSASLRHYDATAASQQDSLAWERAHVLAQDHCPEWLIGPRSNCFRPGWIPHWTHQPHQAG